ncbi:DUF6884 domain-containing protein [Thermodesulfobacteriota bacterium]
MKKIVLISCVSKKLPFAAKAQELYISPLFRLNFQYASSLEPDVILILSAKHGLVSVDQKIAPYEQTLNSMPIGAVRKWAAKTLIQLKEVADLDKDHFVILAGEKYRRFILPYLKSYEIPMKGLKIGEQLSWLKKAVGT